MALMRVVRGRPGPADPGQRLGRSPGARLRPGPTDPRGGLRSRRPACARASDADGRPGRTAGGPAGGGDLPCPGSPLGLAAYRAGPASWFARRWFAGAVVTAVSTEAARGLLLWLRSRIIPNGLDIASYENERGQGPGKGGVSRPRRSPRRACRSCWLPGRWCVSQPPGRKSRRHRGRTARVFETSIDGIDYRGRVSESEKRRLLGEASIMAAPNLGGESFGLVVVEAMASGCAVVASDLPAFRAVVADAGRPGATGRRDRTRPGDCASAVRACRDRSLGGGRAADGPRTSIGRGCFPPYRGLLSGGARPGVAARARLGEIWSVGRGSRQIRARVAVLVRQLPEFGGQRTPADRIRTGPEGRHPAATGRIAG